MSSVQGQHMKVSYDETTDTLSVILKDDTPVAESDEEKPGIIQEDDAAGNLFSGSSRRFKAGN
jgi:hypothetical protein